MEPLLDSEARRADFDILAYAERLLHNFDANDIPRGKKSKSADGSEGSARPFAELANSSDKFEVCRMFLATLQLTNQGNVELEATGSVDKGDMALTVNLLSRQRRVIEM